QLKLRREIYEGEGRLAAFRDPMMRARASVPIFSKPSAISRVALRADPSLIVSAVSRISCTCNSHTTGMPKVCTIVIVRPAPKCLLRRFMFRQHLGLVEKH